MQFSVIQIETFQDFEKVLPTLKDAIFLKVDKTDVQKQIFEAAKGVFLARQWYEPDTEKYLQVKCDSCATWVSVHNMQNECCGDDDDVQHRCGFSSIPATCCGSGDNEPMYDEDCASGKIYFFADDDFEDWKIRWQTRFMATSTILICKPGYPYKHNNSHKGSFRKWKRRYK